jgi:Sap, sulfolipid-1-addressing protein
MLADAVGLAVLAALSPAALLIAAVYLGSARPRLTASSYLAGAVIMSIIMAVIVLAVLRNLGLSRPSGHTPRYGLRLALGVILIGAGLVIAARKAGPSDRARQRQGLVSRMVASPAPRSAFAVGLLVFAPGATFVAAIQVIATARASLGLTVLAVAVVVAINVMLVWLPILLHLAAPAATERRMSAFNRWLRAHGRMILAGTMVVAGVVLAVNGTFGLVTG